MKFTGQLFPGLVFLSFLKMGATPILHSLKISPHLRDFSNIEHLGGDNQPIHSRTEKINTQAILLISKTYFIY